jgi:hypothetical protein
VWSARRRRQSFVASCAGGAGGMGGDLAQVGDGGGFVVAGAVVVGVQE